MKEFSKATFVAVLSLIVLCSQDTIAQNNILASVDEKAITLTDVIKRSIDREQLIKEKQTGDELNRAIKDLRDKTLNEMIVESLLIAEFKQNEFPIPNRLIKEVMDKLVDKKGFETVSAYEEKGHDIYALEQEAKYQIAIQTLLHENVKRTISVSPKETFEFYNSNLDKFLVPKLFSVNLLFLSAKDRSPEEYGQMVIECYESTKFSDFSLFTSKVKKFSSGPNPDNGGSLGYLPLTKMQKQFASMIEQMAVKEFKGPLVFPGGTYFLYLEGVKEAYIKPFKDISEAIKNHMYQQKHVKVKAMYIEKLKTKHTVVINGQE